MKRFLLLCLLSIFSFAIYGNVYFRHLGKAEGLPQVSVCGICQDELGRMWFGTLEGLCCWDGNTMITYDHFPADTHSFLRQPIFHIAADKQGNIFFISGYNLVRYNLYKHRFSQLKEQVVPFMYMDIKCILPMVTLFLSGIKRKNNWSLFIIPSCERI